MIHLLLLLMHLHPAPKVYWFNGVPSCPLHYSLYVDEHKALAGKDGARCVPEVVR